MTFDIVIGNPPYNNSLWEKFVHLSFDRCKEDGFISLVHPGMWRVGGKAASIKTLLTSHKLKYLNMNPPEAGKAMFSGAETSFDYYVVQKTKNPCKTVVVGTDGEVPDDLDLTSQSYIPGGDFEFHKEIMAQEGEETYEFFEQSDGISYSKTSTTKDSVHKYPIQYGPKCPILYSSKPVDTHMLRPKLTLARGKGAPVLLDKDGTLGTCSSSNFGLFIPAEDLEAAQAFIIKNRKRLKKHRVDRNPIEIGLLKSLRKEFWKPRKPNRYRLLRP